jgi:DNA-binding response OmpR family regulator
MKLLVVDDNEDITDMVKIYCESKVWTVQQSTMEMMA